MRDPLEELQHAYAPGVSGLEPEHDHAEESADPHAEVPGVVPSEVPGEQPPSEGRQSAVFEAVAPAEGPPRVRSTVQFLSTVQPAEAEPQPEEIAAPEPEPVGIADLVPYPGDDAPREEIAAWMARHAAAAGIPGELPVMAALVESNLKNIPFGHADSVGFFQMRLSIWNEGDYAGYPDRPELQLKWFLDGAVALKENRLEEGVTDFGADESTWGEWVADVERPAEELRYRYQERLEEARALLGSQSV
jgi:hypothetical protein